MSALLDSLCEHRAFGPLRCILPCWPIYNPFTEDWALLARALKTARMQHGDEFSESEMELLVSLQHFAEEVLDRHRRGL
jgi:hypothetical protein